MEHCLGMENLAISPVTYINPQLGLSAAQQQRSKEGGQLPFAPTPMTPPTKVTDSPGHYPRRARARGGKWVGSLEELTGKEHRVDLQAA